MQNQVPTSRNSVKGKIGTFLASDRQKIYIIGFLYIFCIVFGNPWKEQASLETDSKLSKNTSNLLLGWNRKYFYTVNSKHMEAFGPKNLRKLNT